MKYAYLNGNIKPLSEISISPYDLGFLRGYSVCSVLRTTARGNIFLLSEQFHRVNNGAKDAGLDFGLTQDEFEKLVYELMEKNKMKTALIRIIVSGGKSADATFFEGKSTVFIVPETHTPIAQEKYTNGIKIVSLEFAREYPRIKTTNYFKAVQNQSLKKDNDAFEILFCKDGTVLECSTSNIFLIKGDTLITPKDGCLAGTTRALVLKLAKENNIPVEEREVKKEELLNADAAFLTAANKDILPINAVDNTPISVENDLLNTLRSIRNTYESSY